MSASPTVARSTIDKPLDRDAWLAVRQPFFNASSAAVLYDRHPFQTPGDYAAVKLTGDERSQTRSMLRGINLEAAIADWWAADMGYRLHEPGVLYVAGRMMATVDRVTMHTEHPVEIKTVGYRCEEPLRYWLDQCQAIMWCVGSDTIDLVWFDTSMDIQWTVVDADPVFQADMADRAERFMASLDLGIVPDWVTMTAANVATIHPNPAGAVELDDEVLGLLRIYVDIGVQIKEAEEERSKVKDQIAVAIGDAEVGTFAGEQVVSWKKSNGFWAVDQKAIKADPDLFERHRVWQEGSRRFMPTL